MVDAEQVDDRQMLARLWHDALVCRNHEEREVDAPNAGKHVLDEPLVAGNINNPRFFAGGQPQPGEAKVDR